MTKKLALIPDVVSKLEAEGVSLTPNAVRARLRTSMRALAEESCKALGVEMDDEKIEEIAGSRAFQEAVASLLNEDDI